MPAGEGDTPEPGTPWRDRLPGGLHAPAMAWIPPGSALLGMDEGEGLDEDLPL